MKSRMKRTVSRRWLSSAAALAAAPRAELVERIVARVNDRLITQSEFDKRLSVAMQAGARPATRRSSAARSSRT